MNQGSIESRSSAAFAVELGGLRAPSVKEFNRLDSMPERFDSIFDNLQGESQAPSRELRYQKDESLTREDSTVDIERNSPREVESEPTEKEAKLSTEQPIEGENKTVESESPVEGEVKSVDVVPDGDEELQTEKGIEKSEDGLPEKLSPKQLSSGMNEVSNLKVAEGSKGKGDENRAVKTVVDGKVGTSKAFTLQSNKVTIEKNANAGAVVQNPGQGGEKSKVKTEAVKVKGKVDLEAELKAEKPVVSTKSVKVDSKVGISAKPELEGSIKAEPQKDASSVAASKPKGNLVEQLEKNEKSAVKKGAVRSAKTSTSNRAPIAGGDTSSLNNSLKAAGLQAEGRMKPFDSEIGIKVAQQASSNVTKMSAESKSSETQPTEKGFLKESSDTGALNRAQAVSSRSDSGAFSQQSHHGAGHGSHSDPHNGGRGNEQFRQWVENNSEVKAVGNAAQQTELVDRTVGSLLSARVLNQIVNHIERMRDSEKNRVKVSLGSEGNGVTVDIRIEGDAIYTSFEGDPEILDELKGQWADIKERASRKGVALQDPEFSTNNISYSSSSESESFLPDGGIAKEDMSKSVIQHDNNQPVRPVEMTAAAGSSGPVHSYA